MLVLGGTGHMSLLRALSFNVVIAKLYGTVAAVFTLWSGQIFNTKVTKVPIRPNLNNILVCP